jgi:hypothetical protein
LSWPVRGAFQLCRERLLVSAAVRACSSWPGAGGPLDRTFFASRRRRSSRGWYRPAREPLPAEPGRWVVCALLGRARRARGWVTPGDDRLETRVYAVKRQLFRLGHAAGSARYATSVEQLVVGLAAVMGWGGVPLEERERARFVRAHRRSVQRWLDDRQLAGMLAHEPQRDGEGLWWRTQIQLLTAPSAEVGEMRHAALRAASPSGPWTRRVQ